MGHGLFKEHLRLLQRLHGDILCPKDPLRIPGCNVALGCLVGKSSSSRGDGNATASGGSSFGSSCTSSSAVENHVRDERQRLRAKVGELRARLCKPTSMTTTEADDDNEDARYAFTPAEVRRIVTAAHTTFERLMVLLFLTTGVRRGGLTPHP